MREGLRVISLEDLMATKNGGPVVGRSGNDLVLGFAQGGVSRASFRTRPGVRWTSSASVFVAEPGELLPVRFGPMFYDKAGAIIQWWPDHQPDLSSGEAKLRFESVAPEGAALVRLGMLGPWRKDATSTAAFGIRKAMMARTAALESVAVFEGLQITNPADLVTMGNAAVGGRSCTEIVLGFGQGGVSRASFRTQPGVRWACTTSVSLARPGELLPARFGPVFYDEKGEVIEWWQSHKLDLTNGDVPLKVESVAPEGAVRVKLGMLGPWEKDGATTAAFEFRGATMVRQPATQS